MSQATLEAPTADAPPIRRDGERWAWEVATLYPPQGTWDEEDYLDLTMRTNRLVELVDGCLEVLPMPNLRHQMLALEYCNRLNAFARPKRLGIAAPAPLPVRLGKRHFREPDVAFFRAADLPDPDRPFTEGPALVMEVLSEGNRKTDLEKKRVEYAETGIAEYWIIDPRERWVLVLALRDGEYEVAGEYREGDRAASVLLEGFEVDVAELFAAGDARL